MIIRLYERHIICRHFLVHLYLFFIFLLDYMYSISSLFWIYQSLKLPSWKSSEYMSACMWEGTGGQNLPPPVPFCPASPASFTGNILYYNRACVFWSLSITQTKDNSRRVDQRRIFARTFVSFVYFDAICKSNNMIMIKLLFIIFFVNVVSRFPLPEDSRLPLFPLPPLVTFLPGSRPPASPHMYL